MRLARLCSVTGVSHANPADPRASWSWRRASHQRWRLRRRLSAAATRSACGAPRRRCPLLSRAGERPPGRTAVRTARADRARVGEGAPASGRIARGAGEAVGGGSRVRSRAEGETGSDGRASCARQAEAHPARLRGGDRAVRKGRDDTAHVRRGIRAWRVLRISPERRGSIVAFQGGDSTGIRRPPWRGSASERRSRRPGGRPTRFRSCSRRSRSNRRWARPTTRSGWPTNRRGSLLSRRKPSSRRNSWAERSTPAPVPTTTPSTTPPPPR